jgi:3-dehydroquinate synthase
MMIDQTTELQRLDQTVQVSFRYPVCFTTELFAYDNPLLADIIRGPGMNRPRKILCIIDQGVVEHHPNLIADIESYSQHSHAFLTLVCAPLIVEGGEQVKNNPAYVSSIHQTIHAYGIDRHSYVLAIGGGAVLDMVGYAAATAHRGVRLIRVPTTVLSQNDSGVGVKNSVNAFDKKNFLGTFAPPSAVLNDLHFLTTLSDRDWRSGIAEALKVALLKDVEFLLYPTTKVSPGRAIDMIEMYGSERICVASACDWGPSEPIAVPQFIFEMRRRGHPGRLIHTIVYENPVEFLSQSPKFRVPQEQADAVLQ